MRSPTTISGRLRTRLSRLLRYAMVSGISTVTGLSVLGVLVTAGMSAGWANVIATAIGTVPSFELNRRWVWSVDGRRSVNRQMLPFVLWSFLELLGSTLVVHLGAGWASDHHLHGLTRTVVVELSSVVAFGSFWVVQYVLLDKVLFRSRRAAPDVLPASVPGCAPALGAHQATALGAHQPTALGDHRAPLEARA
jgi:putative flippase GtrA